MSADRDIVSPEIARDDLDAIFIFHVRNPEQIIRQQFAETAMDLAYTGGGGRAGVQTALVDPFLDGDMSFGLELEIAFFGIVAVIALEGALDVDGVRIVSFDEIAVIAVHRTHEIGEG